MDNIKIYEVDAKYINYLSQFAPHLFLNKQAGQQNERKYIGVVLSVNDMDYFAPLSSFKPKHNTMKDGNKTALGKRCNDFTLLEDACKKYK